MPSLYSALATDWHLLHRPRLAAVDFLAALAGAPPARVVDVAAATGEYAALLQQRGFEAYAVEVNHALCDVARARHPQLNVIHGDMLEAFDLVRGPLDLAYCIGGALCELASEGEVADVINQLLDLVRPAGCVVIETPNFDHLRAQALRLRGEVNSADSDVRYGDLEDAEHHAGSPGLGSISDGELRLYLPPVSAYREEGSELRLEQQFVWRDETGELTLRRRFAAPGESCGDELPLLELTRDTLAKLLPAGANVHWLGDWDGSDWSSGSAHTIAVFAPL